MASSPDLTGYVGVELLPLLGDAVTVLGPDWRYLYVSAAAAEIIGRPPDECVGAVVWDLLPEVVGTPQHAAVVQAMEHRTRETFSWYFDTVDRWYEQHALPVGDGLVVYVLDISERMAEVTRAEHLSAAGDALAGSVSIEEVNRALGTHVLRLVGAAGGSVILADDERQVLRAVGWESLEDRVVAGFSHFPIDAETPSALAHRTGEPVFVEDLDDAHARFPLVAAELVRLGCGAAAALPLVSAGIRLGAWSLFFPAGRVLTDGDRRFLVTTAAMIAQAVLRARLLDAEHRAMAQLQRSLLPRALDEVAGLDIAVRYAAGDAAVEVGGDWYDVVCLEEGAVGLVMGDVEGHDVEAAACMGLVRSAVRAYAAEGHPPAIVMQLANRFVADVALDRMVTVSYMAVHPDERLVTVVSAGHLPVYVVDPAGGLREIPSEVGPPLGVHADGARWPETTSTLPVHSLFAAFTDGLVETRQADIDIGLARVREVLVARRADGVEDVADALLASRSPTSGDDVAMLVGRLTADESADRRSTRRMPATSASVFLARRSTRQLLVEWELPAEVVEAAELVVSELVTNAARHSEDALVVSLSCRDRVLRVEVSDTSHRLPALPGDDDRDDEATSGRGLLLVDALADRWGVRSEGLGKHVWAEFDLPTS